MHQLVQTSSEVRHVGHPPHLARPQLVLPMRMLSTPVSRPHFAPQPLIMLSKAPAMTARPCACWPVKTMRPPHGCLARAPALACPISWLTRSTSGASKQRRLLPLKRRLASYGTHYGSYNVAQEAGLTMLGRGTLVSEIAVPSKWVSAFTLLAEWTLPN